MIHRTQLYKWRDQMKPFGTHGFGCIKRFFSRTSTADLPTI